MSDLPQRVRAIFRLAWQRYGKPRMWVVGPISGWSLPAGFAYSDDVDQVIGPTGVVLPNPESYWVGEYIYIVPTQRTADLEVLVAAGVVPVGTVDAYILAEDLATVRAAHSIQVNGDWYDVIDTGTSPVGFGADASMWARVRLRRRS